MFTRRRLIIGGAILAVLVALLAWRMFFSSSDEPALLTAEVTRGDIEQTVEATGTVMPSELVSVGAQASGRIELLNVALGDTVKQGQLIAQIDSQTQTNDLQTSRAQLADVRAQLAAAQATLVQAKQDFRRQQILVPGEATSQADYDAAQATLKSAQAGVDAAQAQLRQSQISVNTAEVNLGYTRVVAPMDGVVVAIVSKQGTTVNANQSAPTIVVLAKLDTMTIEAEISEADVIKVKPEMPVYFTILGDPDTRYDATLRQIEPAPESIVDQVDSSSSSSDEAIYYNALFDVDNPDGTLRSMMTANVTIVLDRRQKALQIPSSALGAKGKNGTYAVQVMNEKGRLETRQVKIGLNTNVVAEVLSGLEQGDKVVVGEATASNDSSSNNGGGRMGPPPM